MVSQTYKNLLRLFESLESQRPFDRLKKMFTVLLAIFFIIALTVLVAGFCGVKPPGYQQGCEDGYRASYQAAFEGENYNVKAGLAENRVYNDGYVHGYDEGYPDGQVDRAISQERTTSPKLEADQEPQAGQNNETNISHVTDQNQETGRDNETSRFAGPSRPREISYRSDN